MMNRRTLVKQLFIIAGGIAILPSCLREQGGASIVLQNIKLSASDEDFLAKLAEIVIPKTEVCKPFLRNDNAYLQLLSFSCCLSPVLLITLISLIQNCQKGNRIDD